MEVRITSFLLQHNQGKLVDFMTIEEQYELFMTLKNEEGFEYKSGDKTKFDFLYFRN